MTILKIFGTTVVAVLLLFAGRFFWLSYTSAAPEVKLVDGQLRPCPETPNCVSSESAAPASHIEPLRFKGSAPRAWGALEATVRSLGGTIVVQREDFLWATFTSRFFRFVDDVEFRMVAEQGVIHLRSASRVGQSDMGVNRKRVERLRALFQQRQG